MSTPTLDGDVRPAVVTIKADSKLRVSLPTALGRRLGLEGGEEFEVYLSEEHIPGQDTLETCIVLRPLTEAA